MGHPALIFGEELMEMTRYRRRHNLQRWLGPGGLMGRQRSTRRDTAMSQYVQRKPDRDRVIWREYLGRGRFGKVVTLKDATGRPLPAQASHRDMITAYNDQVARNPDRSLG